MNKTLVGFIVAIPLIIATVWAVDFFRGELHRSDATPKVVHSVATATPSAVDVTVTPLTDVENELPVFEADIEAIGSIYWPKTNVRDYQPRQEHGLVIRSYVMQTAPIDAYSASFPNGMEVGTICPFFRVIAYKYNWDNAVASTQMRALPGPGEIP